jgi:hypothetical protein
MRDAVVVEDDELADELFVFEDRVARRDLDVGREAFSDVLTRIAATGTATSTIKLQR